MRTLDRYGNLKEDDVGDLRVVVFSDDCDLFERVGEVTDFVSAMVMDSVTACGPFEDPSRRL